jgi:hypothetical protein
MVCHRDQTGVFFDGMFYVGTVDPDVAGTEPVGRPAGDHYDSRRRDGLTGHKLSSHSPSN